ncbi:hypothetical protein PUN28_010971 [Cardiocondyla obscurior]|uniref:Uncharacterized protein n=1 Tax=Cardiocondyla obscurior TaxID=286306 RepID=A0AAW2FIK2_9HYME
MRCPAHLRVFFDTKFFTACIIRILMQIDEQRRCISEVSKAVRARTLPLNELQCISYILFKYTINSPNGYVYFFFFFFLFATDCINAPADTLSKRMTRATCQINKKKEANVIFDAVKLTHLTKLSSFRILIFSYFANFHFRHTCRRSRRVAIKVRWRKCCPGLVWEGNMLNAKSVRKDWTDPFCGGINRDRRIRFSNLFRLGKKLLAKSYTRDDTLPFSKSAFQSSRRWRHYTHVRKHRDRVPYARSGRSFACIPPRDLTRDGQDLDYTPKEQPGYRKYRTLLSPTASATSPHPRKGFRQISG